MEAALARLPDRARQILLLRLWNQADWEDIARECGTGDVASMQSEYCRALTSLMREMDDV